MLWLIIIIIIIIIIIQAFVRRTLSASITAESEAPAVARWRGC